MKGSAGVPVLQLETLNRLIEKMPADPTNFFSSKLPAQNAESDTIKWELEYGSAGMTPFVAPGSVAPAIGMDGVGEGSAKAAFYKEKMYLDEVFLNNLRQPGTHATYQTAERKLTRGLAKLKGRLDRRTEWMAAKAITEGTFTYTAPGGTSLSVSYGIPSTHLVQLLAARYWTDGASRNPIQDILAGKTVLSEDAGVKPDNAICNSKLLEVLMLDSNIQALLAKSAFGDGDLFARPAEVIGQLLGVGTLQVYDGYYEDEQTLTTAVVAATTTTFSVTNTTDIEVGSTARFIDVSQNNVWEDATVSDVDQAAGTVTISAVTTLGFKAAEDIVRFRKKYIDDNVFLMFASRVGNDPIGEFMKAPFGLNRNYGTKVDSKEEWDPEGVWLRVQSKGLPVIYHPDAIYRLKVY